MQLLYLQEQNVPYAVNTQGYSIRDMIEAV